MLNLVNLCFQMGSAILLRFKVCSLFRFPVDYLGDLTRAISLGTISSSVALGRSRPLLHLAPFTLVPLLKDLLDGIIMSLVAIKLDPLGIVDLLSEGQLMVTLDSSFRKQRGVVVSMFLLAAVADSGAVDLFVQVGLTHRLRLLLSMPHRILVAIFRQQGFSGTNRVTLAVGSTYLDIASVAGILEIRHVVPHRLQIGVGNYRSLPRVEHIILHDTGSGASSHLSGAESPVGVLAPEC